jgi:hypothetical protein
MSKILLLDCTKHSMWSPIAGTSSHEGVARGGGEIPWEQGPERKCQGFQAHFVLNSHHESGLEDVPV